MTPRETAIEIMAEASWNFSQGKPWASVWEGQRESFREESALQLDGLLAALPGLGLKVVGQEPDDVMLTKGHAQIDWCREGQDTNKMEHPSQTLGGGSTCKDDIVDAWNAMLAASKNPLEKPE